MAEENESDEEIFETLERRALFDMSQDDEDAPMDVIRTLSGDEPAADQPGTDVTLGGYIDLHNRVPAFEGLDSQPYTMDVDVEPSGEGDRAFVAFFVFIRWAATGAGIMDHAESGDIAWGATEEAARNGALDLTLYEVKAELDAAIERKRKRIED